MTIQGLAAWTANGSSGMPVGTRRIEKLRMRNFCLVQCPKGWGKPFTVKDLSLSNGHGESAYLTEYRCGADPPLVVLDKASTEASGPQNDTDLLKMAGG